METNTSYTQGDGTMEIGQVLTVEFLNKLKAQVKASSIPGKRKALEEIKTTTDYVKSGIKLTFQPGSNIFIVANQVFVNAVDVDIEE